jgi:hypothetical protein
MNSTEDAIIQRTIFKAIEDNNVELFKDVYSTINNKHLIHDLYYSKACEYKRFDILDIIYERLRNNPYINIMENTSNPHIFSWLIEKIRNEKDKLFYTTLVQELCKICSFRGELDKLMILFDTFPIQEKNIYHIIHIGFRHLHILEWIYLYKREDILRHSKELFRKACFTNTIEIAKWLYSREELRPLIIEECNSFSNIRNSYIYCAYNHIEIVRWLLEIQTSELSIIYETMIKQYPHRKNIILLLIRHGATLFNEPEIYKEYRNAYFKYQTKLLSHIMGSNNR